MIFMRVYRDGLPAEKIGSWNHESDSMADFSKQENIGWSVLFALKDSDVTKIELFDDERVDDTND